MKIVKPSAELIWITPEAEKIIELAGRTCYKSEENITTESSAKFIQMILSRGHDSVLEHASASFRVITDRGISHEIVRHRIGVAYSQESTRYCNYGKEKFGKEITVVKPSQLEAPEHTSFQRTCEDWNNYQAFCSWQQAMEKAEETYFHLLDSGASPQTARSVLPTCLKTEIVMSFNFRAWRHFLKLRTAKAAHPDIRIIAKMIQKQLHKISPTVFLMEEDN